MATLPSLPLAPRRVNDECFCFNAQRAARRMARLYDDAFRPFGLSQGQFSLMMVVAGLGPISVSLLADELVMDRTTVTAALKPLLRRGLVAADINPLDLRQHLIGLSPPGKALLGAATRAWQRVQDGVEATQSDSTLRVALKGLSKTSLPKDCANPTPENSQ